MSENPPDRPKDPNALAKTSGLAQGFDDLTESPKAEKKKGSKRRKSRRSKTPGDEFSPLPSPTSQSGSSVVSFPSVTGRVERTLSCPTPLTSTMSPVPLLPGVRPTLATSKAQRSQSSPAFVSFAPSEPGVFVAPSSTNYPFLPSTPSSSSDVPATDSSLPSSAFHPLSLPSPVTTASTPFLLAYLPVASVDATPSVCLTSHQGPSASLSSPSGPFQHSSDTSPYPPGPALPSAPPEPFEDPCITPPSRSSPSLPSLPLLPSGHSAFSTSQLPSLFSVQSPPPTESSPSPITHAIVPDTTWSPSIASSPHCSARVARAYSAVTFADDVESETREAADTDESSGENLGHGLFQLRILAFVQMSTGMLAFDRLSIRLLAPPIDHWCKPPPEFAHMNTSQWKSQSIPVLTDGTYSKCTMYAAAVNDTIAERAVVPCGMWDYDVARDVVTIVNEWNLVCDAKWTISAASVYHLIGALVLLPLLGQMSDKVGRKPVACGCVLLSLAATVVALHAKKVIPFFTARMFISAAWSPIEMALLVLLFESSDCTHRLYYCSMAEVGSVVATLVENALEYCTLSRRLVCSMALAPSVIFLLVFVFVEESPLWLFATCDSFRGERVIRLAAKFNKAGTNIAALITRHSKAKSKWPKPSMNFCELLFSPSHRSHTLALCWVWFSLFVTRYGMPTHVDKTLNLQRTAIELVPHLASMFATATLLSGCKRKRVLSLVLPLASVLCGMLPLGIMTLPDDVFWILSELAHCSVYMNIIFVTVYSLEVFPTVIRGTGFSAVYFCGRLGAVVASLLETVFHDAHPSVHVMVISAFIFSCIFLLDYLPETKDTAKFSDVLLDLKTQSQYTTTQRMARIGHTSIR